MQIVICRLFGILNFIWAWKFRRLPAVPFVHRPPFLLRHISYLCEKLSWYFLPSFIDEQFWKYFLVLKSVFKLFRAYVAFRFVYRINTQWSHALDLIYLLQFDFTSFLSSTHSLYTLTSEDEILEISFTIRSKYNYPILTVIVWTNNLTQQFVGSEWMRNAGSNSDSTKLTLLSQQQYHKLVVDALEKDIFPCQLKQLLNQWHRDQPDFFLNMVLHLDPCKWNREKRENDQK